LLPGDEAPALDLAAELAANDGALEAHDGAAVQTLVPDAAERLDA
jgi:hypothetical protein